jgi:uncharacterized membrane protein
MTESASPRRHAERPTTTGAGRHLRLAIRRARHRRRSPGPAQAPGLGARLADTVAATVGSWRFIVVQSLLLGSWILGNAVIGREAWGPYPFILLNLLLSFQAAYTAPIIMMSQNRSADLDRDRATADYQVNIRAEAEIALLHEKIDLMREGELLELTQLLKAALARIETLEGWGPRT